MARKSLRNLFEPGFGGISGLSVTADGRLTAVTDRGHWFTARIVRDRTGRLIDLADGELGPLLDAEGRPLVNVRLTLTWIAGESPAGGKV